MVEAATNGESNTDGAAGDDPAANRLPTSERPLSATSRLQIVESTDARVVVVIPGGGTRARSIGWFALLWNGFLTVFTAAWVGVAVAGRGPGAALSLIPLAVCGLFWAMGLGMAYAWMWMRFTQTVVVLEPQQAVVARSLLGRRWTTETILDAHSHAVLGESYSENDRPVHHVAIKGGNRTEKFGTGLAAEDKEWLVGEINSFLGVAANHHSDDADEGRPSLYGAGVETTPVDPLSPWQLPHDTPIIVDDASPSGLRFSLPLLAPGGLKPRLVSIALAMLVVWILVSTGVLFRVGLERWDPIGIVVACLFGWFGLVPLVAALVLSRGRVTVEMPSDQMTIRWGLGPFRIRRSFPIASITEVGISEYLVPKRGRRRKVDWTCCMVQAEGTPYPLTTTHATDVARQVAGLVQYQLDRHGPPVRSHPRAL